MSTHDEKGVSPKNGLPGARILLLLSAMLNLVSIASLLPGLFKRTPAGGAGNRSARPSPDPAKVSLLLSSLSLSTLVSALLLRDPSAKSSCQPPRLPEGQTGVSPPEGTEAAGGSFPWPGAVPQAGQQAALSQPGQQAAVPGLGLAGFREVSRWPHGLWRALIGMLAGLALALLAQGFFDAGREAGVHLPLANLTGLPESRRLTMGFILYAAAGIVWGFSLPPLAGRLSPVIATATAAFPSIAHSAQTILQPVRPVLLGAACLCYAAGLIRFGLGPSAYVEDAFVRWMWVLSMLLLLASQLPRRAASTTSIPSAESPAFRRGHWIVLGAILLAALWLRLYNLETLPYNFHGDMASHGLEARLFLSGANTRIFQAGWANLPRLTFLPAAASMAVFGDNLFGLRMASVLAGMGSLLALYLLTWRLFDNHRLAALATAITAITTPHIHFSRIAEYIDPWPWSIAAFFLLVDGLRARRRLSLALAGVLLGLASQMYYSGRVAIFILAGFLAYLLLFHRRWVTGNVPGLGLMALGFLFAFGPSLVYFAHHGQAFMDRSREVWLFSPDVMSHLMGKYGLDTPVGVVLEQVRNSLLMFHHAADTSTQFGYRHPMFHALLAPFIVLGLPAALRAWKHPGAALCLIWLGLVMTLGSVLTVDAPFWPRLVGVIPAAALLAALPFEQAWGLLRRWNGWLSGHPGSRLSEKVLPRAAGIALAMFIAGIGWQNWSLYTGETSSYIRTAAQIGRFLNNLPTGIAACEIVDPQDPFPYQLSVREVGFLAFPRQTMDFPAGVPDAALEACPGPPFVWILSPRLQSRLPAILQRWPGGILEAHSTSASWPTFTSYLVLSPAAPASESQTTPVSRAPGLYQRQFYSLVALGSLTLLGLAAVIRGGTRRSNPAAPRHKEGPRLRRLLHYLLQGLAWLERLLNRITTCWAARVAAWRFPPVHRVLAASHSHLLEALRSILHAGTGIRPRAAAHVLVPLGLAYLAQVVFDLRLPDELRLPGLLELSWQWAALLSDETRLWAGMGLTLAAAILWAWQTAPTRRAPLPPQPALSGRTPAGLGPPRHGPLAGGFRAWPNRLRSARAAWLGAGLACSLLAVELYWDQQETALVRLLYAAGLLLVLVYAWRQQVHTRQPSLAGESSPPFGWLQAAFLAGALLAAFALRIYRLEVLPLELSTDMATYGLIARSYLTGEEQRIFGEAWFYLPRLAFLPFALSMQLAGNNLFGLYFGTVLMSMVQLAAVYLLVWRLFDSHRLAGLALLITLLNPAHIHFSRIPGFIDPWVPGTLALFLLVDGLRSRRCLPLALAGVLLGFSLQNYPAGRVLVPVVLGFFLHTWWFRRSWILDNRGSLALFILGGLVAFGPNLVFFTRNWDIYVQRAQEVALFHPDVIVHLKSVYNTGSVPVIIWEQFRRAVFTFQFFTDRSAQFFYAHPMFHPWLAPLLYLGVGTAAVRWRKPAMALTLLLFGAVLLLGGVLTVNAPSWSRMLGIIPMAALLIALPIDAAWQAAARRLARPARTALLALLCAALLLVGIQDWQTYYRDNTEYARPVVRVGRYLQTLPAEIAACGLTSRFGLNWAESAFLAWPHRLVELDPQLPELPEGLCPPPPVVWILSPDQAHWLDVLRSRWPQGIEQLHIEPNGAPAFTSYLVLGDG